MKNRKKIRDRIKEGEETKLSMTPMIDVVFLLLIFFMCATKFKVPDYRLDADLPKHKGTAPNPIPFDDIPDFTVTIEKVDAPKGEVRAKFRVGRDKYVDLESLAAVIKHDYHALAHQAAVHGKKIPAVIRGDKDVDFGYIVAAVDACIAAKVATVEFDARIQYVN